jgi:hypothetical protein
MQTSGMHRETEDVSLCTLNILKVMYADFRYAWRDKGCKSVHTEYFEGDVCRLQVCIGRHT